MSCSPDMQPEPSWRVSTASRASTDVPLLAENTGKLPLTLYCNEREERERSTLTLIQIHMNTNTHLVLCASCTCGKQFARTSIRPVHKRIVGKAIVREPTVFNSRQPTTTHINDNINPHSSLIYCKNWPRSSIKFCLHRSFNVPAFTHEPKSENITKQSKQFSYENNYNKRKYHLLV